MNTPLLVLARSAVLLFLAATSSGCATVLGSKTAPLMVDSSPSGAEVRVAGQVVGRTPVQVQIEKAKPQTITVELPGLGSQQCTPKTSVGMGWAAVDTFFCVVGFPFGCITFIDAAGAWNDLDKDGCHVTFSTPYQGYPQQQAFGGAPGYPQPGALPQAPQPAGWPAASAQYYPPPPPPAPM